MSNECWIEHLRGSPYKYYTWLKEQGRDKRCSLFYHTLYDNEKKVLNSDTRNECKETFFNCHLHIWSKETRVFVSKKPFQPSITLVNKAVAYLSEEP